MEENGREPSIAAGQERKKKEITNNYVFQMAKIS